MDSIKALVDSIDVNNLLKLFDMQIAIGICLIFLLLRGVFASIIIKGYYAMIKSDGSPKESGMYKPLKIMFLLLGFYFAINVLPTSPQVLYIMNKILRIVVIIFVTKLITNAINVDSYIYKKLAKSPGNRTVSIFLCRIARFIIWIISSFICVNELGYRLDGLGGLAAGLGIGSAGIALAAQDFIKGIISGFVILTDKPFKIGDWVEIGAHQGTVIDITFRSVRIKSYNNSIVTIPNSTITSEYIVNWNKLTSRRYDCVLNLSLDTTSDQIRAIVKKIKVVLENHEAVIKDTVQVNLNAISHSSADLLIYMYIKETNYAKFLMIKQEILCLLLETLESENIELAYPTQTLYVRNQDKKED